MLEMFKRAQKIMLILAIPYIALLSLFLYRVDAQIIAPGNLTATEGVLMINREWQMENPYHSIYVMSFNNPTLFQYGVGRVVKTLQLDDPPPEERRLRNPFEAGQAQRRLSFRAAMIATLKELDMHVEYETYVSVNGVFEIASPVDLSPGERILAVNGRDDIHQALEDVACNEEAELLVQNEAGDRDPRTVTMKKMKIDEDDCRFGLSLVEGYAIDYDSIDLEIVFRQDWTSFVGGPSGGLMQALYFHHALTGEDLTEGRLVAGTGTIDAHGNVGRVGGIREKVITAGRQNVDILFIPLPSPERSENYDEAVKARDEFGFDIEIVPVATLREAIDHLKTTGGGDDE